MLPVRYSDAMKDAPAHLVLKLDTDEPIELGAFVGAFTSIGNELERFVGERYPDFKGKAEFYVREVRAGCVEADIIPLLGSGMMFALSQAESLMLVEDFVRRWGSRIQSFVRRDRAAQPDTKAEVKDYLNAVVAIANDPNAASSLSAAVFEDGKREIKIGFQFTSEEAREAIAAIEDRRAQEKKDDDHSKIHHRVLMVFTRSDISDVGVGKPSGERVLISEISDRPLALMYGADLAAERIKHEIRDADDNLYKKGFVVDVRVQAPNGRPVAYAVMEVHEVIHLPEE
ncbi:hypothetical protein [Paracoccus versutus]|uniref:Uncharacterized protein n=1 Tax=Paracoccus versutus TaxID=34007 RepID=A0A3D9XPK3_PARVE|nr:hypothetical protein [Paracoccus versutus]REF72364.1 hypothetical protein BDD41_0834 [Paracoccus versutus]